MEKDRLHYELCGITHRERFVWEIGLVHDTTHHVTHRDPLRFETILDLFHAREKVPPPSLRGATPCACRRAARTPIQ